MSGFTPEPILTGPAASNWVPPDKKKKTWWLFLIKYSNQRVIRNGEETLISVMHLKSMLSASSELL